jgi:DNA-binding transcriptional LysR family regulator
MGKPVNLLALRLFVRVATHSSFSQAAAELGLQASSASRYIAALEDALGHPLFHRHTRAVRLTDAGSRYYDEIREAIERIDQAGEQLDDTAGPRGTLRINAPPAFARLHLAPMLARFQADHPGIEVEMLLTEAFLDPVEHGADISIRIGELADSRLVARPLAVQRFVVCATPAYLERHGAPAVPEDLRGHNCMVYLAPRGPQKWHFRQDGQPWAIVEVAGNVRGNHAEYLLEAALRGQGLVMFATWTVSHLLAAGRLVTVLDDWTCAIEPQALTIHAVYPRNRGQSRKTQAFLGYLGEQVGTPAYWDHW